MKIVLFIVLSVSILWLSQYGPVVFAEKILDEFVVADFGNGVAPNNIGGSFGVWNYDPNDMTQGCVMQFATDNPSGLPMDYSLQLDYDVDSPNPAFNGFWMKLQNHDVSAYNQLCLWVKGVEPIDQKSRFKIELKNTKGKRAIYFVKGITSDWKKVRIDFKNTNAIVNWTQMSEFTIVFSDLVTTQKKGTIFIDSISFLKVSK